MDPKAPSQNPASPEDEQPKKKRRKRPLIIGGALAAAAMGYLALAPKSEPTKAEQDATRAKIAQVVPPDAGARIAAAKKLAEIYKQSNEKINLENAPRLIHQGNFEAAEFLHNEIWKRLDQYYRLEHKDPYASACASVGITTDESEIITAAIMIRQNFHSLENPYFDVWDVTGSLGKIIEIFEDHANDPFNPLLLNLLGMDEQQLSNLKIELLN